MEKQFKIGDFVFRLNFSEAICMPKNFLIFEMPLNSEYEYTYEISLAEQLPKPCGKKIAERQDLQVFETETGEERLIGIKGTEKFYAYYKEEKEDLTKVFVSESEIEKIHIDTIFCSLLALERRMIKKRSFVLHCAYIKYQGEAILFSAPSETGKTTQANLWEKYRNSKTINGDKALIGKKNGQWVAQGWPVCGSSGVCYNEKLPIRAIVLLSQAKENNVEKVKGSKAFSLLYGQITANRWNTLDNNITVDMILELMGAISIYHLGCTISKEAVECLEKVI